jgi:hypothetical protein
MDGGEAYNFAVFMSHLWETNPRPDNYELRIGLSMPYIWALRLYLSGYLGINPSIFFIISIPFFAVAVRVAVKILKRLYSYGINGYYQRRDIF